MRILHTADWHLGDRIGSRGIDRTADLRKAVERIAEYCADERPDVLLVAGDLFSDKAQRQDDLGDAIKHLGDVFRPFFLRGGTILALTGNHDREATCQTLRSTLTLAAPRQPAFGDLVEPGRLYLAAGPTLLRLEDADGTQVQFILMPYPTPTRYLDDRGVVPATRDGRNATLQAAYATRLQQVMKHRSYNTALHTVLAAHIHVGGATVPSLFRMTAAQDVIFSEGDVPAGFAYVALGHIHRAQTIGGQSHVRYSGSIDRLDLGERDDEKSVSLVTIGPCGREGDPRLLPLDARPLYRVEITDPDAEIPRLRDRYPDHARALVSYRLVWTPGRHQREDIVNAIEDVFPHWYDRDVITAGTGAVAGCAAPTTDDPVQAVEEYLTDQLATDPDCDELLRLVAGLLEEVP
ncbi:metallophosphoesterase family protein [Zavarzinella formosa]|uniref:metallophosphoesterase family protein n=1 Tax=Zavarzinella formosa TaxID=360055 RepID=UPI0002E2BBD4|nr:exonuclease subunit SbcD [Zavarzinella formosa]